MSLLKRLVGSGCCAGAKTLHTVALPLVYTTTKYCAAVWCHSAHTRLIDSVLNDGFCIVTECLRHTPTDQLSILSSVLPDVLRQPGATLSLGYRGSLDPDHLLYGILSGFSDARQEKVRPRCLFVSAARNLLNNLPE